MSVIWACTVRVGQYLGANQPIGAITACRVALTVQGLACLVFNPFKPCSGVK